MFRLAADQGELDRVMPESVATKARQVSELSLKELREEKKKLSEALRRIQGLLAEIPWANWKPIYNEIGAWLEIVKMEIPKRVRR